MARSRQHESDSIVPNAQSDSNLQDTSSPPEFRPRLSKPHQLIKDTQAEKSSRDEYGYPARNAPRGVDIDVSKTMFKTALVVMDRFIKALEKQELKVDVVDGHRGCETVARLGRDQVRLSIHETTKRIEHVPTAKELRDNELYSWRIPKWDNVHTAELVLRPGGVVDVTSEDTIDQIVRKAVADVVEELDRVRKHRIEAEAAQERERDRQRRIEDEKKRVTALHNAAEALRQYRILTDYIEEVRRFGRAPEDQRREGQTLEEWLNWAEIQAQRLHPLG